MLWIDLAHRSCLALGIPAPRIAVAGLNPHAGVAMYHDQGHIPMKLLAFDSDVNVGIGLPILTP